MARLSSSRDISFETDAGAARIRWDGPRATLFLDGVESSAVDTSDPTYLEFEYMQHMSAVVRAVWGAQDRFRALHVGGAACALACAWSASYPSSRHVAVEVDRLLAEQVREHFPIPKAPQVKIRVGDGRSVVEATREGSVDVIVRDAFASGVTPAHLRTLECARLVRRALTGRGVYLACNEGVVNVDDIDRALRMLALPARITRPRELERWVAGCPALTDKQIGYPPAH